ncbi:MAG: histidinol-phosphate transaminase [Gammaproteobacteria bacterium]
MTMQEFDPAQWCVPGVRQLKPYEPGKPIGELQRELGLDDIIKLASNENPLGPSPRALEAMRQALDEVALYPDGNAFALKQALADHHGIGMEHITVGTGSDHILELIARAFLGPDRSAVFARHAFAIYAIVSQAAGAELRVADAHASNYPQQPYGHDVDTLIAAVNDSTRVVFVANPNNPTGTYLTQGEIERLMEGVPAHVVVVIDEAYYDYAAPYAPDYPDTRDLLERYPNLVVLRTFSKAYGLAGVRIGYALASAAMTDCLNRVRLSFNPSSLGQAAAVAALVDRGHVQRTVELNHVELQKLDTALRDLGLNVIPSVCNFVTADMGRPGRELFQQLLREGVIVRPLDGYGLANHLRISVGLPEHNRRLIQALRKVLAQ